METIVLLGLVLAFAVLAALSQAVGVDSRGWTTEGEHRPWL